MSVRLRFALQKFYDSESDILKFIEGPANCTVTNLSLDKVNPEGPFAFENCCKIVRVVGNVQNIRELITEKFPGVLL